MRARAGRSESKTGSWRERISREPARLILSALRTPYSVQVLIVASWALLGRCNAAAGGRRLSRRSGRGLGPAPLRLAPSMGQGKEVMVQLATCRLVATNWAKGTTDEIASGKRGCRCCPIHWRAAATSQLGMRHAGSLAGAKNKASPNESWMPWPGMLLPAVFSPAIGRGWMDRSLRLGIRLRSAWKI